jgi:hypothetical protein
MTASPEVSRPYSVFPTRSSGFVGQVCLTRTACAFRFSQPPDALLHSEPTGLVSCRIRSWGSPFRALFLIVQPYADFRRRSPHVVGQPAHFADCRNLSPTEMGTKHRKHGAKLAMRPSTSGCCSTRESTTVDGRFRPDAACSPLGTFPLQGSLRHWDEHSLRCASPHAVAVPIACERIPLHFRVLFPVRLACLSQDCRPSWGFLPWKVAAVRVGRSPGVASSRSEKHSGLSAIRLWTV